MKFVHSCRAIITALLLLASAGAQAQWSTITLQDRYTEWTDQATGNRVYDVLHLMPVWPGFTDQVFGNPHVVKDDSGNWLITGYGDHQFGDVSKGDSTYIIKRLTSGAYERNTTPVLSWPAAPAGSNWTSVGGIDAGVGVTKTPTTTVAGYKYFMLVPIWDMAHSTHWISWAVSSNGTSWSFVNATATGTTSDPGQSLKLIRKQNANIEYYHPALMYNPADGYFYAVVGYRATYNGVRATWWRIKFTTSNSWGLEPNGSGGFKVERLDGANYNANSDGTMPANDLDVWLPNDPNYNTDITKHPWPDRAAEPRPSPLGTASAAVGYAADPLDLIWLTKADGSFDSVLFIYLPEQNFSTPPDAPVYYVKASLPASSTSNFVFGTPQRLDLSALRTGCGAGVNGANLEPCYNQCSGSGVGFYLGAVQAGTDTNGYPLVYGFITAWREDLYSLGSCPAGSAGVLPVRLKLQ